MTNLVASSSIGCFTPILIQKLCGAGRILNSAPGLQDAKFGFANDHIALFCL